MLDNALDTSYKKGWCHDTHIPTLQIEMWKMNELKIPSYMYSIQIFLNRRVDDFVAN